MVCLYIDLKILQTNTTNHDLISNKMLFCASLTQALTSSLGVYGLLRRLRTHLNVQMVNPFFQSCCHTAKNRSATRCILRLTCSCTELHAHPLRAHWGLIIPYHGEKEVCADRRKADWELGRGILASFAALSHFSVAIQTLHMVIENWPLFIYVILHRLCCITCCRTF